MRRFLHAMSAGRLPAATLRHNHVEQQPDRQRAWAMVIASSPSRAYEDLAVEKTEICPQRKTSRRCRLRSERPAVGHRLLSGPRSSVLVCFFTEDRGPRTQDRDVNPCGK